LSTELTVVYPPAITTAAEKQQHLDYLYETLRRDHNARGDLYEAGELTEAEWQSFLADVHRPRRDALALAEAELHAGQRAEAAALPQDAPELAIDLDTAFGPREVN
jgi:hypothetical protein